MLSATQAHTGYLSQDISVQDTTNISKDSLDELVPYLDEVEADSPEERLGVYSLAIAISTFFSEDLAVIGGGIMSANGLLPFWYAVLGAVLGIFIGDFSLYLLGRYLGKPVLKYPPFKWFLSEESIKNSSAWFNTKGPYILIISRFIPGSRMPVYISAGMLEVPFWKFALYFGGTVLLWTPIFLWLSMKAGEEILYIYEAYDQFAIPLILLFVIIFWGLYKLLPLLFTVSGRRHLWDKVRKLFKSKNK
ncbi:DedA family protein [Gracilimonas sp.]|uniref:DedA family protein n=1 Tax=Gracilimonas sp. TaxID=1974203 RepID=UPI0028713ED2|nr:DedA family protein [Gracilimonas sp.]